MMTNRETLLHIVLPGCGAVREKRRIRNNQKQDLQMGKSN